MFVGRLFLQGGLVADAGEIRVRLPVLHGALHFGANGCFAAVEQRLLGARVSGEPVERLLAQTGPLLVVELARVLALPGGGQGGVAGGGVAMTGLQVVGQFRVGSEGVGIQPGRHAMEVFEPAQIDQGEAFVVGAGPVVPP
jgi:hypothetical protein